MTIILLSVRTEFNNIVTLLESCQILSCFHLIHIFHTAVIFNSFLPLPKQTITTEFQKWSEDFHVFKVSLLM